MLHSITRNGHVKATTPTDIILFQTNIHTYTNAHVYTIHTHTPYISTQYMHSPLFLNIPYAYHPFCTIDNVPVPIWLQSIQKFRRKLIEMLGASQSVVFLYKDVPFCFFFNLVRVVVQIKAMRKWSDELVLRSMDIRKACNAYRFNRLSILSEV